MIVPAILTLEAALVDHLAPHLSPVPVEPFPDRPDTYREQLLNSEEGVVLVGTARLVKGAGTEAAGAWLREMSVSVLAPGLRGEAGQAAAYGMIEAVVSALDGVRLVVEDEPMRVDCREVAYQNYLDGFWEFSVELNVMPALWKAAT